MYYSPLENVKILVAMLKAYDIRHIVLSPGNRNIPLVYMVEKDDFFKCYSIVDERSAAFFACGLIQKLQCAVAICCTSGTAVCNYSSGVAEAYYQHLPLLVLTADRNPYYLNQNEDQMIPQNDILDCICKISVQLPFIREKRDDWYCKNRIHLAMLELYHGISGPVHINFPIEDGIGDCSDGFHEKIPVINRIYRYNLKNKELWNMRIEELKKSKIMIVFGQNSPCDTNEMNAITLFASNYDCVILADHLSNYHGDRRVNAFTALETMSASEFDDLCPDILISVHGNFVFSIKEKIQSRRNRVKHWSVTEDGMLRDSFRCLDSIFECSPYEFYSKGGEGEASESYYEQWRKAVERCNGIRKFDYSSAYAVGELMNSMPDKSLLHIANSTSVRLANIFSVNKSIEVYCNRGTNGIDGSFSSFMGNAIESDNLCFLIIGDLSFFYDLNAIWNRYRGKNIRVLLNNNEGAEIFHYGYGTKLSNIDMHIAAAHTASAKGWVESQGFMYLSAANKQEFDKNLKIFINADAASPILFEVFTKKDMDSKILHDFYNANMTFDLKRNTKIAVKNIMEKNKVMEKVIRTGKNIVEQNR